MATEVTLNSAGTKESPPLDERVKSLLNIYNAVLWKTTWLDVSSPRIKSGQQIDPGIAIANITRGVRNHEIDFLWPEDYAAPLQKPAISLIKTATGEKRIQVIIPATYLEELEREIKGLALDCDLPYFFYQTDRVAGIIKKIDREKIKALPIWELIKTTTSKIYTLYLDLETQPTSSNK